METLPVIPASAFTQLAALRDEPQAIYWKPQIGDNLSGVLLSVNVIIGINGSRSKIMNIKTQSGEVYSTWITAYIEKFLTANQAQLGDLLSITYQGKGKNGAFTFNKFDLHHISKLALVEGGSNDA